MMVRTYKIHTHFVIFPILRLPGPGLILCLFRSLEFRIILNSLIVNSHQNFNWSIDTVDCTRLWCHSKVLRKWSSTTSDSFEDVIDIDFGCIDNTPGLDLHTYVMGLGHHISRANGQRKIKIFKIQSFQKSLSKQTKVIDHVAYTWPLHHFKNWVIFAQKLKVINLQVIMG